MAKRTGDAPAGAGSVEDTVGTLVAFDGRGAELFRAEGFRAGRDMVPRGVSMAMRASVLLDPSTGEVLRQWNPWGVLG